MLLDDHIWSAKAWSCESRAIFNIATRGNIPILRNTLERKNPVTLGSMPYHMPPIMALSLLPSGFVPLEYGTTKNTLARGCVQGCQLDLICGNG